MFSKQDELKHFSIKIFQCHHQMKRNFPCSQLQGLGKGNYTSDILQANSKARWKGRSRFGNSWMTKCRVTNTFAMHFKSERLDMAKQHQKLQSQAGILLSEPL